MSRLCLTRRINEAFLIGDNVRVSIGEIHGRQVRIYIEAPKEVVINREELLKKAGDPPEKSEPPKM